MGRKVRVLLSGSIYISCGTLDKWLNFFEFHIFKCKLVKENRMMGMEAHCKHRIFTKPQYVIIKFFLMTTKTQSIM